jgi:dihydrofolate reductase
MARLTMTAFVTLDGVMQAPGGPQEDVSGGFTHGGWLVPYVDQAFGEFMTAVFSRPVAFLLGRGTWQIFAGHWPKVTDPDDLVARKLNWLPKYVAPRTLASVDWSGSRLVRDVPGEVAALKRTLGDGELQVHGSPGLAQALLEHGLVDELNLLTFPVVLGVGKRLFGGGAAPTAFELVASQGSSTGVLLTRHRRIGRPSYGQVAPPPATAAPRSR